VWACDGIGMALVVGARKSGVSSYILNAGDIR